METQITVRPKVTRLLKRFEDARKMRDVPEMMKVIKRLRYKEDCLPETIHTMQRQMDLIVEDN